MNDYDATVLSCVRVLERLRRGSFSKECQTSRKSDTAARGNKIDLPLVYAFQ
jgi:hypothetical protein